MAWTIVDKDTVANLSNVSSGDLKGAWSDLVEGKIKRYTSYDYIGETQAITDEEHDGTGTTKLFVDKPPIVSVSGVQISSTSLASTAYKVYRYYVELVTGSQTDLEYALDGPTRVFPEGNKNVKISYTSGESSVPADIKLAAIEMIATIAQFRDRGGSVPSLKYDRPSERDGRQRADSLSKALDDIMEEAIDKRHLVLS